MIDDIPNTKPSDGNEPGQSGVDNEKDEGLKASDTDNLDVNLDDLASIFLGQDYESVLSTAFDFRLSQRIIPFWHILEIASIVRYISDPLPKDFANAIRSGLSRYLVEESDEISSPDPLLILLF